MMHDRRLFTLSLLATLALALASGCDEVVAPAANGTASSSADDPSSAASDPADPASSNGESNGEEADPAETVKTPPTPQKTENITFDDLKFEIEKGDPFEREMLSDKIEDLVGKKVRIRGYILPPPTDVLSGFTLVRDNQECCFGPKAALYDNIKVQMAGDRTTNYTALPVTVEGVFSIKEVTIGKITLSVFRMEADKVN